MKINKLQYISHKALQFVILSFFIVPVLIYAQPTPIPPPPTPPPPTRITVAIPNPVSGASNLMELLVLILNNIIMPIAAVAVVMWILWAGFSYLMANGNETKIGEAHQRLLWSLIGAGILLGAAGISAVVQNTFNSVLR